MDKKGKLEKTKKSEFHYFEKHYEEMMKQMEEDQKNESFDIRESWDQDFRETMETTLLEKEDKQIRRRNKRLSVAAAAVLCIIFMMNDSVQTVYGGSFARVFKQTFNFGEKNNIMIGTSAAEEDDVLAELSRSQVYFEDMSLEEIYKAVQKEVSTPILYMTYFPESYVIKEAKYDREYGLLNLKFENDEKTVYVSQRKVDDECSIGLISDEQILETVDNQALGEQISIFRSEQDESCAFAVAFGNRELVFNGKIALDECKKIAESIHYGK